MPLLFYAWFRNLPKTITRLPLNAFLSGSLLFAGVTSCATSFKPCTDGGDVSWTPMIKGDRRCTQITRPDGSIVNHGKYIQWYADGKVAIEGEFDHGLKTGTWIQYDEQGRKVVEKLFVNGVETFAAQGAPPRKSN